MFFFVLSQSTRVTDRITTPKTAVALLRRAIKIEVGAGAAEGI